ncbi:hypothetical protein HY745_12920, partial [Candidatus Desantisbacteria bacterium]|nr:hypothetical protein [Candidatus Desantisbacteria bacterium]
MKILIIATAYNRDYDCQALMYEYFASKPDTEVWAIAPLFTDTTRGQIEARRDEKSNGVRIKRIYKNIPEMWNVPFAAQKELDQICRDFKPDIIWCWHEGNYPIASYIHAKTNAPIVLYLECPGNKIVETAKKDKVPIILSCVRIHKLFEKDMTRDGFYFLQVSAPAGVPDASSYWQKEKNNRGIFCGSLGYEYKWPKYFMELLPQLFEKTSMESFFLLSSGSKYPSDIMSTIGKKFPITYVPHLTRREIFQEIAKSKFGFITMKGPWPGAFPGE